jgi:hypothetical protein
MERRFGSFSRAVRLPFEAGEEQVDAKFSNGVLTVSVPKPAKLQRSVRRIEVKVASRREKIMTKVELHSALGLMGFLLSMTFLFAIVLM